MNGLAIPINISKERLDELAGEMVGFINVMTLLGELAKQRTITMFQTQGKWATIQYIPVEAWELTFALADKEERKRSKAIIREIVAQLSKS